MAHWPERCPGCAALQIRPSSARFSPGWIGLWHEHVRQLLDDEWRLAPVFSTLTGGNRPGGPLPFCVDELFWASLAQHYGWRIWEHLLTFIQMGKRGGGGDAVK